MRYGDVLLLSSHAGLERGWPDPEKRMLNRGLAQIVYFRDIAILSKKKEPPDWRLFKIKKVNELLADHQTTGERFTFSTDGVKIQTCR
jgi:hypothetical protein